MKPFQQVDLYPILLTSFLSWRFHTFSEYLQSSVQTWNIYFLGDEYPILIYFFLEPPFDDAFDDNRVLSLIFQRSIVPYYKYFI